MGAKRFQRTLGFYQRQKAPLVNQPLGMGNLIQEDQAMTEPICMAAMQFTLTHFPKEKNEN